MSSFVLTDYLSQNMKSVYEFFLPAQNWFLCFDEIAFNAATVSSIWFLTLPKRNCKTKTPLNQLEYDSAIRLHLLQNRNCAAHYHDRQFSILAKARTQFHFAPLEAILIKT